MHRPRPSVDDLRRLFLYDADTGQLSRPDGTDPTNINKRNYRRISIWGYVLYVHTIAWAIMTGEYPAETIDHKDLDTLNNRWFNLRPASQAQQQVNRKLFKNNKSGFRGVYERRGRFCAMIRFDKKTFHLGTFGTAEEAAEVVQKAREARWGEFARAA